MNCPELFYFPKSKNGKRSGDFRLVPRTKTSRFTLVTHAIENIIVPLKVCLVDEKNKRKGRGRGNSEKILTIINCLVCENKRRKE